MNDTKHITLDSYKRTEDADSFYVEKEKLPKSMIESIEVCCLIVNKETKPFYKYNLVNGENRFELIKKSKIKESTYQINKLYPDRPRGYRQYVYTISEKGDKKWYDVGVLDLNYDLVKTETDIFEKSGRDILLLREVTMKSGNIYHYLLSKN